MRVRVAADNVPTGLQIAHLPGCQEARLPNLPRGDQKMAPPAELFQHASDVRCGAYASIIKAEQIRIAGSGSI